ncbi:MAG: SdrD B-like domain-containing protein [Bacteroidota bacterium]
MTVDFGFIPQMSIGSTVFYDPNDNGIQDTSNPLEDGIAGVTVNLYYDADGDGSLTGTELTPVATTVTDAEGDYFFGMLPEGDYIVGVQPTGDAPVSSTGQMTADGVDGNDNGEQPGGSGTEILSNPVNLDGNMETHTEDEQGGMQDDGDENNGDMTVDFGLIPNMSIGSTVFLDNNDDGMQDPLDLTEVGIPSVIVELLFDANNDGVIDGDELIPVSTIWTDSNGDYFFGNLPEGNYQVVIPTAPASAPTSSTPTDTMDNREDGDDNGVQPGGPGTAVTSPIINLTPTEEPLDADEGGQGGMQDNTASNPDENGDMTVDFGFIPYVSVGSNVFADENNDGIDQGVDEEGIEGITVEVYSTGPDMMIGGGDDVLVGMDVTDINGDWFVDSLTPGEFYAVINSVDPNYPTSSTTDFDSDDQVDNNDNGVQAGGSGTTVVSNEFTLTGDAEPTTEPGSGGTQDDSDDDNGDMTIDFGFVPYYSLGNQVWIDDNYDGLINGSEVGIDGVEVELYDLAGTLIDMTVTMNGGLYLFDNLLPGDYIVVIPASELAPNGTLQDYQSSTGTFNMGGPFENPGVDAETNTDNDDNGTFNTNVDYPSAVVSTVVTLGGGEPLNENPDNDPNTLDQYENLTVDFGFIRKIYDVALIKETAMETGNKVGETITFTIAVTNQGNTPLTNIEVTDYIAPGFINEPVLNAAVTDAGGSGWSPEVDNKITYVIGNTLLPNETVEITVFLELGQSLAPGAYTNFAEVSEFQDTIGNSTDGTGPYTGGIDDVDSTPDDVNGNDPGGQPDSDADDHIDGDGTGTPGDGVPSTDEDDHDPAMIKVVDIALAKTVVTPGPYSYGQEVQFNIEVINQGNVDLENILVSDYIPCGFTFGPSNSGWSVSSNVATTTIAALAAGASTDVSIYLTVTPVSGACDYDDAYVNFAEVSSMFADYDGDGIFDDDASDDDVDSSADSDEENDAGGEPETDSDDYVDGDGTGGVDDGTDTTDEDDHDPAFITIFDLAQIKYIDDLGPYDIGTTATFTFEVTNQGNVDAYNIEITDYLMDGFEFSMAGNAGWSESGDNLVYTIAGPLAPGETETITLDLTVVLPDNATVFSWYNESEISSADDDTDDTNQDPTDADSTPDDDPNNDNDLTDGPDDDVIFDPDDENDNVIDENPNDPFGTGDDDEDDNDAAGILVVGGLGDTVWKDADGDGIQDAGEDGVEGVVVILTDCSGTVLATETTDANGFYFFDNLIPGNYQVQFDVSSLPDGCSFTVQDQGGDDALDSDVDANGFAPCTFIQGGEYDSTFDAGLIALPNIGDFVWHDTDGDGIQDPGEPGIEDVMVLLYNEANELIQVTVTNSDGYYLFTDVLPDTYYIVFVDPEGFTSTFPNTTDDENDSDITNFVFTSEGSTTDLFEVFFGQEDDLSFDAGYYMCIPIGELAWYDVDEDDVWDSNENGINGLEVRLYRLESGGYELFDEMLTGHKPGTASDDGYFKFCAPPGTYYIEIEMPPIGLVQAQPNQINGLPLTHPNEPTTDSDLTNNFGIGTTASFSVMSGEMLCNIGGGFYPMATAGNRVWIDSNENGLQDSGEQNMPNVKVEAYEAESGLKVAESTTNNQGIYKIEYLQKTDYYLKFIPPTGFGFTNPNMGDEDNDSDVDHSYGFQTTAAYSMQPGETYINIDAGLRFGVLPVVWTEVNAEYKGDHNLVTWGTASEVNTESFVIERSVNEGNLFEEIGEVEAAGESSEILNYEFKDEDVRPGVYYYRIKQVDRDGKFEYSDIVRVTIKSDKNLITLAPNPAHEKSTLSIELESNQEALVTVTANDGRLIRSYTLQSDSGNGVSAVIELEDLPAGVYSVGIVQGVFKDVRKLIIVE